MDEQVMPWPDHPFPSLFYAGLDIYAPEVNNRKIQKLAL
jgi:hypothetical protein